MKDNTSTLTPTAPTSSTGTSVPPPTSTTPPVVTSSSSTGVDKSFSVVGCFQGVQFYLHKLVVYETKTRFFIVGSNRHKTKFRLLKLDRTDLTELSVSEDPFFYSRKQIQDLLNMIDTGNKGSGGLKKTCVAYGLVGFVRFLYGYYLLLITKKRKLGEIGGHYVYGISDTAYLYIPHPSIRPPPDLSDEARYKALFFGMDLTKDFYFSYTYDLTHTLQYNMCNKNSGGSGDYNSKFVWNNFLLEEFIQKTSKTSAWVLPIIHGFYSQSKFSVFSKSVSIAVIARRSRYFAGTRFLKRGINEMGHVANEVETEQIVMTNDSPLVHENEAPCSHLTSFVQLRGSIPLYWSQDISIIAPKPPIILQRRDPFYNSTILHFADLFRRYGTPVIIMNLVKGEEKHPRETIIGSELEEAIIFLNSLLPKSNEIKYVAFDFRKAHKSKEKSLIPTMHELAENAIQQTGFFHYGKKLYCNVMRQDSTGIPDIGREQHGVIRTNCVDSLDRTNAAQFFIGKCALGHQLYAMGMTDTPLVDFDTKVVDMLTEMYEGMGNQIALQYAGSELVNTVKTYRAGDLVSQSRDLLTTVKRYYSNSFTDAEKQHSINLFLGNFIPYQEKESLWELESDFHLHNKETRVEHFVIGNTHWWEVPLQEYETHNVRQYSPRDLVEECQDKYFTEFYQPEKISFFDKMLSLSFNNTQFSPEQKPQSNVTENRIRKKHHNHRTESEHFKVEKLSKKSDSWSDYSSYYLQLKTEVINDRDLKDHYTKYTAMEQLFKPEHHPDSSLSSTEPQARSANEDAAKYYNNYVQTKFDPFPKNKNRKVDLRAFVL